MRVAITGGIGSGKTTVCEIFKILQIPVLHADLLAKRLMQQDATIIKALQGQFGASIYKNGQLQNAILAGIVFNNREKLNTLNNIVHPKVHAYVANWFANNTTPYAVYESALITEIDYSEKVDIIIGVQCPDALRIQRIIERNKISTEEAEARIASQTNESVRMQHYNYTIVNQEDMALIPQVLSLHHTLTNLANGRP